jgi:Putative zinc-finger
VSAQPECDRAREWASLELDDELSEFERVLLDAHLAACAECKRWRESIAGFTRELRAAPLERPELPVVVRKPRRAFSFGRVPAAAAALVAAIGLGALVTSSELRNVPGNGSFRRLVPANVGATNLMQRASEQRQADLRRRTAVRVQSMPSRLSAGPVVH